MFSYCMLLAICPFVCLWTFYVFDFFSRITWPISTKLSSKHPWWKKIQVLSNEGPHPFPRGDKYMILNGLTFNMEFISQVRRYFWYLQDWNIFHIQCPILRYSLVFWAYFFQFLDTACNTCQTWHHKSLYLSHCENNTFDIFTVWK